MIAMTLLLCLVGCLWAATTFDIDTKYGKEQVVIPDGYTAEEVLLIVAKNYYELNHEHEELLIKAEELNNSLAEYVELNKSLREKYDALILDYDSLVKKVESYGRWSNFKGFVNGSVTYNFKDTYGFGISAGMFLFNKTLLTIGVNFPFSIGVGVGFVI